MTALTRAIVSHDLDAIDAALRRDPDMAQVPENGWLPLQWAEKSGNLVTLLLLAAWMALNVLAKDKHSQPLSLVRVTKASPSPLYPRAGPPSR